MTDVEHLAQMQAPQLVAMCHLAAAEAPLPPSLPHQVHAPQLVAMCHLAAAEAPLPPSLAWKSDEARQQQTSAGSGVKAGSSWGTQDKGVQVCMAGSTWGAQDKGVQVCMAGST